MGPGDSQVQHVLERNHADALGAAHPDAVVGEQVFVLVDAAGEDVDERLDALVPAARRLQGQPANAEVAGHHALAAEHFEDLEDLLALAEAVEEHGHGADIERVRTQPHQMAVETRQFGEHDAHPLGLRRDLQLQQLFHRQAPAQIHGERRQVIHAVRQGDRLLIGLDFEFLFDAGMQKTDVRLAEDDCFAIQFQQQAQHAVRGRVLRPHVEDHAARAARGLFFLHLGYYQSRNVRFAHTKPSAP